MPRAVLCNCNKLGAFCLQHLELKINVFLSSYLTKGIYLVTNKLNYAIDNQREVKVRH